MRMCGSCAWDALPSFDLALAMPRSSAQLRIEDVCYAGTVISTPLYPNPSMFTLNSQVYEELNVSLDRNNEAILCVPHVVVTHREGSGALDFASNEMCFALAAGLHQRRLLGFENHIIFGVACGEGKSRVYASYWRDDEVRSLCVVLWIYFFLQILYDRSKLSACTMKTSTSSIRSAASSSSSS